MSEIKSKVLALKYRPQTFDHLIGQDIMVETITNSIKIKKIPNAYLFTGIRGVGKTTTARIVAKALNCKNGIDNLCKENECEHCEAITNANHLDILEMDGADKTGIDDVRDLIEFSKYGPTTAKFKIFIVDEVHMLSKQAFNALLKTLEEPPEYLKFIFATTEVRKIPVTVISRCQRFDLSRVKSELLLDYLKNIVSKENGKVSEEALKLIIKISEGSVRDSLSLLDRALITQIIENKELDLKMAQKIFGYFDKSQLIELFDLIFSGKEKEIIEKYRKISDQGVDPRIFLNDFLEVLYFIKNFKIFGKNEINFSLNDEESKNLEKISTEIDNETLIMFWQFTLKSMEELNMVSNQDLLVEMFLIRLTHLKDSPKLEELLNNIELPNDLNPINNIKINNLKPSNEESKNLIKSLDQIKNISQEKKEEQIKSKPLINNSDSILEIKNFEELIYICSKEKEIKLKFDLEKNVRLVKFENGLIEVESSNNFDKDFIKNLSQKLLEWTNQRWIITLSKLKGIPTKSQIKENRNKQTLDKIKESEDYKKIIKIFEDANLINIEDKETTND
jgi:DNA polymerase III subunit gamma/tau